MVDTDLGTVALPERKIWELFTLLDILETHCCIGRKELEGLVENLCTIHLTVLVSVSHLYQIKRAQTQGEVDWAWLSPAFH